MSSPDKLHRNDQAKSTRQRKPVGGAHVDDQREEDEAEDADASKRLANVSVNNTADKKPNGEPAKDKKDARTDEEKKANGVGKPPSADSMREVMNDFREVNGDVGRGKPPDPKANADVMEMFREVNAEPAKDKKGDAKPDAKTDAKTDDEKKANGVGRPPSAESMREVMNDFREVNGDVGRGKPPDPKANADVMEMFREVNGEPAKKGDAATATKTDEKGEKKPDVAAALNVQTTTDKPAANADAKTDPAKADSANATKTDAPANAKGEVAPAAQTDAPKADAKGEVAPTAQADEQKKANGVGKPPSAESMREVMNDFREVNGDVGRGKPPSADSMREVMNDFREVNGDVGRGKPPSADSMREVMNDFREVNGDVGRGKPPNAKDNADVMQMFREVNGGPTPTDDLSKPAPLANAQMNAGISAQPAAMDLGAQGALPGLAPMSAAPAPMAGVAQANPTMRMAGFDVGMVAGGHEKLIAHEAAHVVQQGGVDHDPVKNLAKVAVHQAEQALDEKNQKKPADKEHDKDVKAKDGEKKVDADHAPDAQPLEQKKDEEGVHNENVKGAKEGGDAHLKHLGHTLAAKKEQDNKHLTLDANLAKHAGPQKLVDGMHDAKQPAAPGADPHHPLLKVDGHATGLLGGMHDHQNPLQVDGQGTGVLVDAKLGPNQKVDGHGTGLDVDHINKQKQEPQGDANDNGEIADSEGNVQAYNPMSGKAPAPVAKGGAGIPTPEQKKPELPPPPQTANQTALNSFIDQARSIREAAKKKVGAAKLAKSTAVAVDANHLKLQVEQKNAAKLAEIRKKAEADKAKAAEQASAKSEHEGPVSVESLTAKLDAKATEDKSKLDTEFDAKSSELKTRLESQKQVLQEQTAAQVKKLEDEQKAKKESAEAAWTAQKASLATTRDNVVKQIRENVKKDQDALEKEMQKDGKLWKAANEKMDTIESTWKANQKSRHDLDYAKADGIVMQGNVEAMNLRGQGLPLYSAAYNDVMAAATDDDKGNVIREVQLKARAQVAGEQARAPMETQARHIETKAKLDCKSLKAAADEACAKIQTDGEKAKEAVNTATANQVKAIETKIQDLFKIADGRISKAEDDLKTKLTEGETKLTEAIKGNKDKIDKLKKDGEEKLAKLETESLEKLKKDHDAAIKAIDTKVEATRKQLLASNGKNLKALEAMVKNTCTAIDQQVTATEAKFNATVQSADQQAAQFIAAQLKKIQGEAQQALDAIDKNYDDALAMVDAAVKDTHEQIENTAKGKMLEIEVHIGTMMKDCGDDSRYQAAHDQLEYYVKNKLPIPSGYGEPAPPPSQEAKKEDAAKETVTTLHAVGDDKKDDKEAKPAEPKKDEPPPPVSQEMKDLKADEAKHKALLDSDDLTDPKVLEAKVQEAMKKGQSATGAAAAENAQNQLKASHANAAEEMQKKFDVKSKEMEAVKAGDPKALEEVIHQEKAEDNAKVRAKAAKEAMDKKGLLWGKNPDKKAVLKAMEGMDEAEAEAFKAEMLARGVNMDAFVDKELDDGQKAEARLRLKGDDVGADIAALNAAKGHHMTGNEKLAIGIGAGIVMGPLGIIGGASLTGSDQNLGADKARIQELLNKYKDNPEKLQKLKEALEKDGVSIAQLCHETGNDDLAKKLDPEHIESQKKPEEAKQDGKNLAEALIKINPKLNDPATREKLDAAALKAEQSLHYILDSSKNEGIAEALKDLSKEEADYVKAKYKARTGHDLEADMNAKLSGVGLSTAKASLRADKDTLALNKILGAEDAGWTSFTLDDDKMKQAMKDLKDPEERRKVLAAYERKTGRKLQDVLAEKMSGNDRDIAVAYADGDIAKGVAAEADEAINGGWMNGMHRAIHDRTKQFTGVEVDTERFTRPMVGAMVNPMSVFTPDMPPDKKVNLPGGYEMQSGAIHKVDTDKLLELMESMPNPADREKFKAAYLERTHHNLDDDIKQKTSGVTQGVAVPGISDGKPSAKFDAYKALDDGRMDDYYAAKMDDAVDGMNDSKAFHKCLEGKSERERANIIAAYNKRHPDNKDAFNSMLADQFGKDSLDYQKAQMLATSKDDVATGAVKLPDEFVLKYAQDSVWARTAKSIDGATEIFDKYPFLYAIPIVGTTAAQAKTASYFMRGWGVDKDAIKDVLKGKSKAEIQALREKYKAEGKDLDADLAYVLDGRDGFEVKLMLEEGEPQTDKEKIERKLKLAEFDRGKAGERSWTQTFSNGITDTLSPAGGQMDDSADELRRLLALCDKSGAVPASEKGNLGGASGGMAAATKGFVEARQEITGAMATAAAAIVGAAVTVLTGGAAAPLLAALASGLTTVAVKAVMLGDSYGRSELGVDLAMTAVQVATAGLGGSLGKFGETFLGQVLNGSIGAGLSNFAQTAMTSSDAHDLLNLLAQAGKSGLVGMLSGGANAAATAALGHAMESLSETAFGKHAPLGGIMIKGMVTGAGSSLAGTFAEAILDPDSLKGDWDKVFAKLARGAAEGAFQNALNDVAGAHRERLDAVHDRAKAAVEAVREKNGGKPNPAEEHAAFAKAMSEGYDAVVHDEKAAEAAKKQKEAAKAQDPDHVAKQLENNPKPPAHEDKVVPTNLEEKHTQAAKEDKVGPKGESPEKIKAQMDELAAKAKHVEEPKPTQEKTTPIEEKLSEKPKGHEEEKTATGHKEDEKPGVHKDDDHNAVAEQNKAAAEQAKGPKEASAHGPVVDRYGAAVEPRGLADPATMDGYVEKMKKIQSEWPAMTPADRMKALSSALNEQLMSHGLAPVDMASPKGMHPQMEGQHQYGPGTIHINEVLLNNQNPTPAEFANIANKMYHEARHAEQWNLMVKHLETQGLTPREIATKMHMDERFVKQTLDMGRPMTPEQLADGAKYFDAIYGSGKAHRDDVLSRLGTDPKAYEEYRRLVEERDAWAVGDAAGDAFASKPQEKITPQPVVAIGGDQSAVVAKPIEGKPIIAVDGSKPVVVGGPHEAAPKTAGTAPTNAAPTTAGPHNAPGAHEQAPANPAAAKSPEQHAQEQGKKWHEDKIGAAKGEVLAKEAALATAKLGGDPAAIKTAQDQLKTAQDARDHVVARVKERDTARQTWEDAKAEHQADVRAAQKELTQAKDGTYATPAERTAAIKAAEAKVQAAENAPVMKPPVGHDHMSEVAKATLDAAPTAERRAELEKAMNKVYDDVRARTPAEVAHDDASMKALIDMHLAMREQSLQVGQDIRKALPRESLEKMIANLDYKGAATTDKQSIGGFIGDQRNLAGLTPHEVVRMLGLDYNSTQFVQGAHGSMKGVETIGFIDSPITAGNHGDVVGKSKIPMDQVLIDKINQMAAAGDPKAIELAKHLTPENTKYTEKDNPYTGFGVSTSAERMDGPKARENLTINQEMKTQGFIDVAPGSTLKVKMPDGAEIVVAKWVAKPGGGGEFVMEPGLTGALKAKYDDVQAGKKSSATSPHSGALHDSELAAMGGAPMVAPAMSKPAAHENGSAPLAAPAMSEPVKGGKKGEHWEHVEGPKTPSAQEMAHLIEIESRQVLLDNPHMTEEQAKARAKQNIEDAVLKQAAAEGAAENKQHKEHQAEGVYEGYNASNDKLAGDLLAGRAPEELGDMKKVGDAASVALMIKDLKAAGGLQNASSKILAEGVINGAGLVLEGALKLAAHATGNEGYAHAAETIGAMTDILKYQAQLARPELMDRIGDIMKLSAAGKHREALEMAAALTGVHVDLESKHNKQLVTDLLAPTVPVTPDKQEQVLRDWDREVIRGEHADEMKRAEAEIKQKQAAVQGASDEQLAIAVKELKAAELKREHIEEVIKIKEEGRQAKRDRDRAQRLELDMAKLELQVAKDRKDPIAIANAEARLKAAETRASMPSHAEARMRLIEDRKLGTAAAFCTHELPANDYDGTRAILLDPKNWTPERQAFHEELLQRAVKDAMALAKELQAANGGKPVDLATIFAMRGNTAAGKSRSVSSGGGSPELAEALGHTSKGGRSAGEETLRHRMNNPDNFKLDIYSHDPALGLTSNQAHMESSILSEWFHQRLLGMKHENGAPVDMVIDKRLAWTEEVHDMLAKAKETGRRVSLLDVDADLSTSAAGVLDRKPGGDDPIPPFKVLGEGFEGIRGKRQEVIDALAAEPTAEYKLFATDSSGNKVLVAEMKPLAAGEEMPANPLERLKIVKGQEATYESLIMSKESASNQVQVTGQTVITPDLIEKMTANLEPKYRDQMRGKLQAHVGKTWQEAVDAWSKQTSAPGGK